MYQLYDVCADFCESKSLILTVVASIVNQNCQIGCMV